MYLHTYAHHVDGCLQTRKNRRVDAILIPQPFLTAIHTSHFSEGKPNPEQAVERVIANGTCSHPPARTNNNRKQSKNNADKKGGNNTTHQSRLLGTLLSCLSNYLLQRRRLFRRRRPPAVRLGQRPTAPAEFLFEVLYGFTQGKGLFLQLGRLACLSVSRFPTTTTVQL